MRQQLILLGIIVSVLSGCKEPLDCCIPLPQISSYYIGPYTYIYQGKNPVDGAFYEDTTYIDTFTVTHFAYGDSIRFSNNAFYVEFKQRADQAYTAGPYTSYRLSGSDSMYYDSYFYSGTDADHFYSETFSFRGKK